MDLTLNHIPKTLRTELRDKLPPKTGMGQLEGTSACPVKPLKTRLTHGPRKVDKNLQLEPHWVNCLLKQNNQHSPEDGNEGQNS